MKKLPTVLRVGTRPSKLALTQTRAALDRIESQLINVAFEMVPITSVGDLDRTTDLRESPADFFTCELDAALLAGRVDCAVHSAKDLPDPIDSNIEAFWLPWREEPRDVLVLAKGKKIADLPENPLIGVSSERREVYCRRRFPIGIQKNIRGNIEERIEQVDRGEYDVVVMAAAALIRLSIQDRITEWISLDELDVPVGQGYLAVTLRKDDPKTDCLRELRPLKGKEILLTCSEALQKKSADLVRNLGGIPISFPLIELQCNSESSPELADYNWVVVTSPTAAHFLIEKAAGKSLPKIMVCGRGTADEFEKVKIEVKAQPSENFSADALIQMAQTILQPTDNVLRVRSDRAGDKLSQALRKTGATVDDFVLYQNTPVAHSLLPVFDAVFFASTSAVEFFVEQWGVKALIGKQISAIGQPTAIALKKAGVSVFTIAPEATVMSVIHALIQVK